MARGAGWMLGLYAGLTIPFLLNDFANIYVKDFAAWVTIDYGFAKALPLLVIIAVCLSGRLAWADFGIARLPAILLIYYGLGMSVLGTLLDQYGLPLFTILLPSEGLGGIPSAPDGSVLGWVDLHFGLFMTGVLEELIFRGLAFTALTRAGLPTWVVFTVSSIVFGMIHWSLGVAAVATTGLIGAVFMVGMWRTGSVLPLIFAHFVVNYIFFGF
ncbi:CPBP family intramembrane glutamic endopeptidase [Desulfovibrio ferrophilus]|uniref:Abortive infection protein n=1 Tax=Desulfovibrio ferrophilus TaxID=241368 RepID=A0A2Z6AYX3_9BACT|nr:type II CAAX endopeptidase family protein [Desulfovibrio ferrophilus]BBD08390.1 Abortive infection protein [Desulfovibrio ferrophilus]